MKLSTIGAIVLELAIGALALPAFSNLRRQDMELTESSTPPDIEGESPDFVKQNFINEQVEDWDRTAKSDEEIESLPSPYEQFETFEKEGADSRDRGGWPKGSRPSDGSYYGNSAYGDSGEYRGNDARLGTGGYKYNYDDGSYNYRPHAISGNGGI